MKENLSKFLLVVFLAAGMLGAAALVSAQTATSTATATTANTSSTAVSAAAAQRAALEAQLADLEKQINDNQQTINGYQKQGKTLQNQINTLNAQIAKANLQIKAINLSLTELNQNISDTQTQINQTENKIDEHKNAIAIILQAIYETDRQSLAEILLANNNLSDFFGSLNNMTLVQNNLRTALDEIVKLRQDLLDQKQQLSQEKTDTENLKAIQVAQQQNLKTTQSQKSTLLKETKGKETVYQKILAQNQASAAQIRTRIFELLGGGELTFDKAYNYAKLASGSTGVRPAFILAILNQESLLGKNVGRCSYRTAMNPTRDIPIFLALLSGLNIDPNSPLALVSCRNRDGFYGGAMGPAQFIPSTWKLYANEIANVTGNNPANPWNNSDAFVATGLYIQDLLASQGCKSYANANQNTLPYQTLLERCAAAKYYGGNSWYYYRFSYGQSVVDKANRFEQDIAVITGANS